MDLLRSLYINWFNFDTKAYFVRANFAVQVNCYRQSNAMDAHASLSCTSTFFAQLLSAFYILYFDQTPTELN